MKIYNTQNGEILEPDTLTTKNQDTVIEEVLELEAPTTKNQDTANLDSSKQDTNINSINITLIPQ